MGTITLDNVEYDLVAVDAVFDYIVPGNYIKHTTQSKQEMDAFQNLFLGKTNCIGAITVYRDDAFIRMYYVLVSDGYARPNVINLMGTEISGISINDLHDVTLAVSRLRKLRLLTD